MVLGKTVPQFKGKNQNGEPISLNDYKGKKLALYFYPKNNTPACNVQACNLRDHISELKTAGIEVVGVSMDSEKKHQNFIEKFNLPFSLIADENKEIIEQFEVWGEKKFMGKTYDGILRTTFLIDENGNLKHVIKKPKTKVHAEEILNFDWK